MWGIVAYEHVFEAVTKAKCPVQGLNSLLGVIKKVHSRGLCYTCISQKECIHVQDLILIWPKLIITYL